MAQVYEPVIGLEVHAQLLTESKLFCGCSTRFGAEPNTQVCPICLALPGSLPVTNAKAVALAMRIGLALGCSVRPHSIFARKNYFYPDLPKGYQISQYELPLNERGALEIEVEGKKRRVGITRAHMEEDAAKNLHGVGAGSRTLVDFNRGGVPLVEIVSDPDLRSSAEAEEYLKRLREILMFVGANDGNLEEGSFRCDANVSIRPLGAEKFGTRVELKNINSFRFVRKAIDYEIARQQAVLSSGGKIDQETRTWSEAQSKTLPMRSKEEAMDYRYFPDPDLPPLRVSEAEVERVRAALPELPAAKRARWEQELGLTSADAVVLTAHPALAQLLDDTAQAVLQASGGKLAPAKAGKRAANFIQAEVLRHVELDGLSAKIPVSAPDLGALLWLVDSGEISSKIAKDVFADMLETRRTPQQIIADKGLVQVQDTGLIEEMLRKLVNENPDNVAAYHGGKQNVIGWFVGQVMKATGGRANPKLVNEVLRKLLDEAP
jgi:aspartyl-tRNA(Asn)/glutamyl-tRNA(Gln) amidotransferase subunit B